MILNLGVCKGTKERSRVRPAPEQILTHSDMHQIKGNGSPSGDQTMLQGQQEHFLTLKELCEYFGIHKRVVYQMVRNGLTEYRFSERKAKYELNEVKAFLTKK